MFLILLVLLFTKLRRCTSLEQFLSAYLLKYTKLAVLFSAYVVDGRLCVAFAVLFAVLLLVGPQEPTYAGPTNVKEIGLEYFKSHIDNPKADPAITWIVHLYSMAAEESTVSSARGKENDARGQQCESGVAFSRLCLSLCRRLLLCCLLSVVPI